MYISYIPTHYILYIIHTLNAGIYYITEATYTHTLNYLLNKGNIYTHTQ